MDPFCETLTGFSSNYKQNHLTVLLVKYFMGLD